MEPVEIELVRRAQDGDSKAFEQLLEMHDRSVWQTAYHMLGNLQDTQDMYQETFMRAFDKIGTFRFQSSFKSWLLRITINLCINYRRRKRIVTWISIFADTDDEMVTQWIDHQTLKPDDNMNQKELQNQIVHALDTLSPRERAAFTLKQYQGYKIREIAGILNCAEGSVKNYLFRAMNKMRAGLAPYLDS